jgi:HSP20 family molecular chaperone IbpA
MIMQTLKERAREGLDYLRMLASPPPERCLRAPPVEIIERDTTYVVRADVPGATRRSTEAFLTDERTVLLRARRMDSADDDVLDWGCQIALPGPVDTDHVEANVMNGVLTVVLGKLGGGRKRILVVSTA